MKLIALPDLHANIRQIPKIGPHLSTVDLVLLVGDLTNDGTVADAARVVRAVREFNTSILAVPGNWDGPEVDEYLSEQGINLHRKHMVLNGLALIGMGSALPGPVKTPNELTELEFEQFFEEAVAGLNAEIPKILICHQPPYNTLNDLAQGKRHVGSQAVRAFIEQTQPLICFTGHIHEGVGIDQIGGTMVINPGPLEQGKYAFAEVKPQGLIFLEVMKLFL